LVVVQQGLPADLVQVADDLEDICEYFIDHSWSDGLPVIPPTVERVERMLAAVSRNRYEVVAKIPPSWREATVEIVAINSVMAGCLPGYFPVVVAAVEATGVDRFNLTAIQTTTNPVTPLVIVNGPLAPDLGINSKGNVFGHGYRANSTVGRALRMVLMNVGGSHPRTTDMATQGQPGRHGFCIAENEQDSPWEPLHVDLGYPRDHSVVSVVGVTGTDNVHDLSVEAEGLLRTLCSHVATAGMHNVHVGGGPLLVLGPEHAALLAEGGMSKDDVKMHLYQHARVPLAEFSPENMRMIRQRRPASAIGDEGSPGVTIADEPAAISIIVAGGAGTHSQILPTFGRASCLSSRDLGPASVNTRLA
jgi:hypothetical protein